ncbi:MAG: (2Fe-2S)-binding protein [Spirochaetota bacterium]|nr:MAG: (2Fe-2S)-binding protein [Spirochaetota bacterium]
MRTNSNEEFSVFVCRCEEVTEDDVQAAIRAGAKTVDDIKRATRAGMGLCQSKTCYTNIARIIHRELGTPFEEIEPVKIRIPVRPITADVLADE